MPLTDEQKRQVRALRAEGKGRRKIAVELDVSERMVRDFLASKEEEDLVVTAPVTIYVWDLETTDFKSDIGTVRVASFMDINTGVMKTKTHQDFETETQFVEWILETMEEADILVGQNSVSFDKPFITGVAGRLGLRKPAKRMHWDTYLIARHGWKGNIGYSLENLADHFGLPFKKEKPPKKEWREMITDPSTDLVDIVSRCESDVRLTALVFDKLKPYLFEWRGQL